MTQGFDGKGKYLKFYNAEFGVAKYCTKSWGLASFEAGQQSRQAEIDELQKRIDEALDELQYPTATWEETIYSVINILKGKEDE